MDTSCFSMKNCWVVLIHILLCIYLLALGSLVSPTIALTLGNETDSLALLALKDQLTGGSDGALASWNRSVHFCKWQGVECGRRHQRVTVLKLNSLNLIGSLAPSIGNLTFLREITLSDNRLHGEIPRELGHLTRLRFLNFTRNNLHGEIPLELTNCSNLQVIIFTYNNFTGKIPFQFGSMLQLTRLSLGANNLVGGIPASLGNLSSLITMSLAGNNLEGTIPHALGGLSSLEALIMGSNNLSGIIPPSLYNLSLMENFDVAVNQLSGTLMPSLDVAFPNLHVLVVAANQFTGNIPTSISNISRLQLFDIFGNGFTGSVPNNLGKLKDLQRLVIGHNWLGSGKAHDLSFLVSLTNCSQLDLLAFHTNRFGGQLPDSVANLSTRLRILHMGRNQISGSIPEGIGHLVGLTVLDMGINFLTGTIPDSIGKLQRLGRLFFHRNSLYGEIPSSIGNLSQLFDLYLHTNNFEGSIPLTLWRCKNMQNLYLAQNNLSGIIPEQALGLLESLIVANISRNSLTGPLPSDIGNLKNLVVLIVSENKLSGGIPTKLGECSGLVLLLMEGNFFQESIPSSLISLKSLQRVDLSRNNLSGTIPPELENLSLLKRLNLSLNHLEGEVPTRGVFSNASAFSVLGNKKLCGGIPDVQLPPCFNQEPRKKGNTLSAGVIVAIIICVLATSASTVVLVILCWRRKPRRKLEPASPLGDNFLRVSYKELLQATSSFASSNLIGVGNFGSVYKGFLRQDEGPVAVKVLHLQKHGASKSFMSECKALSKIRHRNLLKVITSCSSVDYKGNDFKALVFELMPNGSLENWLHVDEQHEARNLNLRQMLDIAIDVAYALDYLHHHCETLIVHCDLKPSNVLLDDDLVAHVGDFGLAKILSLATGNFSRDQTNSAAIKGTIGYVAPEYGMGGTVSPLADVYSYGILLLEMLTGKRPTDSVFHDGLNLHNFTKMALMSERLREIVDSHLLGQCDEDTYSLRNQPDKEVIMWDCLVSLARIGVACSAEFPGERMDIKDVVIELHSIKGRLLPASDRWRETNKLHLAEECS